MENGCNVFQYMAVMCLTEWVQVFLTSVYPYILLSELDLIA